jgi:hypothetical protein
MGPPRNLTWDAVPNNSIRTPYVGYIQFMVVTRMVPHVTGTYKEWIKYQSQHQPWWEYSMRTDYRPVEYRYEFDLEPDGLALTKVLARGENESEWKAADPSCYCWGRELSTLGIKTARCELKP